jgi:Zn-dependent metalloprotease
MSFGGTHYVPYERTYAGLPVVGGDFVVVVDASGQIIYNSVALERPIGSVSVTPALTRAAAEAIATGQLRTVSQIEDTQLVVNALGPTVRLAWESTVDGVGAGGISRLTVDVDALTGAVLRTHEHVMYGSGTAAWNGPNPVPLNTVQSGGTFLMRDPSIANLSCQDAANNTIFSGPDDAWGNGNATVRETGCVDALFGAQTEARMLSEWLGRNAMDGAGGAWPIRVGLAAVNAFYDGTQVQIGHNTASQWIGSIDVIAHEMGHGIDDHTPGGSSANGTQEFVADAFGASTEWFAKEPAPFDVPDFTVGEQSNILGSGPIRNLANPSALGDPNCYSSSIPSAEVHSAAGPGNHWFYLLAEGSNPTNGQTTSPTCNGSRVVGLGVQSAIRILYNAMLMKTSGSSYLKYRTWTLQAAKNMFPGSCNTVKAAWDAVSVPAQPSEPICPPSGCIGTIHCNHAITWKCDPSADALVGQQQIANEPSSEWQNEITWLDTPGRMAFIYRICAVSASGMACVPLSFGPPASDTGCIKNVPAGAPCATECPACERDGGDCIHLGTNRCICA